MLFAVDIYSCKVTNFFGHSHLRSSTTLNINVFFNKKTIAASDA